MTKSITGGTNILRGGKRSYTSKTLIGNFVEESYRPGAITAGFSGGDIYMTTNKAQMLEGAQAKVEEFGAALRREPVLHSSQPLSSHLGGDPKCGSSTWVSVTRSSHSLDGNNAIEFNDKPQVKQRILSQDELKEHRERWTKESDAMKHKRYVTENSIMQSKPVSDKFKRSLVNQ